MNTINEGCIPTYLGKSSIFPILCFHYAFAPSLIIARTAEAELLRAVPIESPTLDLCCGDGFFASLIRPQGFEAGCDINKAALAQAEKRNVYHSLVWADISKEIPFPDASFNTVVSNSSLEHVRGINGALKEIARVLKPGGRLYTTFYSSFAYEWWPCGRKSLKRYLEYQPIWNTFSLAEWKQRMAKASMQVVGHKYYLSKTATQLLMFLDYHFSLVSMTQGRTLSRPIIRAMRRFPRKVWALLWQTLFARIKILVQEPGGLVFLVAERAPR